MTVKIFPLTHRLSSRKIISFLCKFALTIWQKHHNNEKWWRHVWIKINEAIGVRIYIASTLHVRVWYLDDDLWKKLKRGVLDICHGGGGGIEFIIFHINFISCRCILNSFNYYRVVQARLIDVLVNWVVSLNSLSKVLEERWKLGINSVTSWRSLTVRIALPGKTEKVDKIAQNTAVTTRWCGIAFRQRFMRHQEWNDRVVPTPQASAVGIDVWKFNGAIIVRERVEQICWEIHKVRYFIEILQRRWWVIKRCNGHPSG